MIKDETGVTEIRCSPGQGEAIDRAMGTSSAAFRTYAEVQLLNILRVAKTGDDFTDDMNAALAMLSAIGPQNELEAMLAVQMVATHHFAMRQLNRSAYASELPQFNAHGHMAAKLQRTFTMQVEALTKLRRGGKQVVEHVHIYQGGQAVIAGTVNSAGGGSNA